MPNLAKYFSKDILEKFHEEVIDDIEDIFDTSKEILESKKYNANYSSFINRDGTIDLELRIRAFPRFTDTNKAFLDMIMSLPDKIRSGVWVSTGVLFNPKDDDNPYHKLEGLNFVQTTYQDSRLFLENLTNMKDHVVINIKKAKRGKISQISLMIHWNGMVEKPKRP